MQENSPSIKDLVKAELEKSGQSLVASFHSQLQAMMDVYEANIKRILTATNSNIEKVVDQNDKKTSE